MADLLKLCKKYFGKKNLYEVLEIDKNASEKDIKRAYHRLSLKVHPDRVSEEQKAEATEKFKVVSKVHSVLNNKSKRNLYDKTGSVENEDTLDIDNWKQYWQCIFKEVTKEDIINYENKYKGSKEEEEDLKAAYVTHKGDMNRILEFVLFSSPDDESRFDETLRKWIDSGEVPPFDKYLKETPSRKANRRKKYVKEAKEAEKEAAKRQAEESETDTMSDLVKAIQNRQSVRSTNFLDNLEQKYSKPESKQQSKRRKR